MESSILNLDDFIGVGLRHTHFPYLISKPETKVSWFEIISENFMDTKGNPFEVLMELRKDYPVSMHGVSLSLGSSEDFDKNYLKSLKTLMDIVEPFQVSDHLCWTGKKDHNLHNLLPLPYNEESLKYLANRIQQVQDYLGQSIAVENLSAYFSINDSTYTEWDFLRELAKSSGCKILLDINNIYVNSVNQKFDPHTYLDAIPDELIGEIHLAGFSDMGDYLFDTHSKPVFDKVWDLYSYKIKSCPKVPVLIEWDEDIPEFPVLENEAVKARDIWRGHHGF